jgi:hypothetical protein
MMKHLVDYYLRLVHSKQVIYNIRDTLDQNFKYIPSNQIVAIVCLGALSIALTGRERKKKEELI